MAAPKSAGIIAAAGSGQRLGTSKPKALVKVGRRTLVNRAAMRLGKIVDEIVVTAPAGYEVEMAKSLRSLHVPVTVIIGGESRTESVQLALAHLSSDIEFVLIHDAARAFAPVSMMRRILRALHKGATAVIPAIEVSDTIKSVDEKGFVVSTYDRETLRAVQTPQGFTRDLIEHAHREARSRDLLGTDDSSLVEALGEKVLVILGDERARKITTPADLKFHRLMRRKGAKL
ncbi:MAG TPA: 2-C-methyl-D-erythritol 4-phosphate cytidylyltransferase [Candidatus Nanopelagicaceae bacterium]|nr:2-C-methyl-D-erythritol 4-phosphate cytidylyltransferase [Candidatus Nanopelagicaceae bacterium]